MLKVNGDQAIIWMEAMHCHSSDADEHDEASGVPMTKDGDPAKPVGHGLCPI